MLLLKNSVNGRMKSFSSIEVLYNKICLCDETLVAIETIVSLYLEINLSY